MVLGIWDQCVPSAKKRHEYTASAGRGTRGAVETVRVRANTPQEAFTRLRKMGYTRISGITKL